MTLRRPRCVRRPALPAEAYVDPTVVDHSGARRGVCRSGPCAGPHCLRAARRGSGHRFEAEPHGHRDAGAGAGHHARRDRALVRRVPHRSAAEDSRPTTSAPGTRHYVARTRGSGASRCGAGSRIDPGADQRPTCGDIRFYWPCDLRRPEPDSDRHGRPRRGPPRRSVRHLLLPCGRRCRQRHPAPKLPWCRGRGELRPLDPWRRKAAPGERDASVSAISYRRLLQRLCRPVPIWTRNRSRTRRAGTRKTAYYRGCGLGDLRSIDRYPGNLYTADNRTFLQPLPGCTSIGEPCSTSAGWLPL